MNATRLRNRCEILHREEEGGGSAEPVSGPALP